MKITRKQLNYLFTNPIGFFAAALVMLSFSCTDAEVNSGLLPVQNLPSTAPKFEVLVDSGDVFKGYILLRKAQHPGAMMMINQEGEIVKYNGSDTTLERSFMAYDSFYVSLSHSREILELNYDGDTINRLMYDGINFDRDFHHEIIKDAEGNYIGLTEEYVQSDLSKVGGEVDDTIRTHGILVLSPSGTKVWKWSLDSVLDPLTFPDILKAKVDWGHANSLFIDSDGNYLVSWRDFNAIWKIDRKTGTLVWTLGHSDLPQTDRFYSQHSVNRMRNGDLLLFDNGDRRAGTFSRALAFSEKNGVFTKSLDVPLPDSLFSFKQGSVYELEDDKLLFCSSMTKYLVVTRKNGNIVWLCRSDESFYRAYPMDKAVFLK